MTATRPQRLPEWRARSRRLSRWSWRFLERLGHLGLVLVPIGVTLGLLVLAVESRPQPGVRASGESQAWPAGAEPGTNGVPGAGVRLGPAWWLTDLPPVADRAVSAWAGPSWNVGPPGQWRSDPSDGGADDGGGATAAAPSAGAPGDGVWGPLAVAGLAALGAVVWSRRRRTATDREDPPLVLPGHEPTVLGTPARDDAGVMLLSTSTVPDADAGPSSVPVPEPCTDSVADPVADPVPEHPVEAGRPVEAGGDRMPAPREQVFDATSGAVTAPVVSTDGEAGSPVRSDEDGDARGGSDPVDELLDDTDDGVDADPPDAQQPAGPAAHQETTVVIRRRRTGRVR